MCLFFKYAGGRPKLTPAEGIRGLMGEKGLMEEWQKQMEEYYNCKWAQEDVETLYNLLNNNNNKYAGVCKAEICTIQHTFVHCRCLSDCKDKIKF